MSLNESTVEDAALEWFSEADKRGTDLGLSNEEVAFYDVLATNDSAVEAMGDAKLRVFCDGTDDPGSQECDH